MYVPSANVPCIAYPTQCRSQLALQNELDRIGREGSRVAHLIPEMKKKTMGAEEEEEATV